LRRATDNVAEENEQINTMGEEDTPRMETEEDMPVQTEEQEDTPMRTEEDEQTPVRTEDDEDSGSGSGSDSESEEEQVEWLATTREKRATAGNRLASLLQQEEPDDELELLFEEPEDDVGFEDAGPDSDVQMDSSSDDEDQGPAAGDDDLDGEKAIQKQERAERQAKKRKLAQVPGIKRKKVKIDPRVPLKPAPRPKKKSERASWLPTAEEAPTRASARKTTKLSKEQLHQQMLEREIKRLRQLARMEKAAAAKEAAKKPEMTQADRLAEAARIEKSNVRTVSRWEEAEQQREQAQLEKLAALQNRHLEGPVVTFWSGMGEKVGGKLKKVGKNLTLEEKEKAPRKRKAAEMEADGKEADGATKPEEGLSTKPEGAPDGEVAASVPSIEEPSKPDETSEQPAEEQPSLKDTEMPDSEESSEPKKPDKSAPPKPEAPEIIEEEPPIVTPAPLPGPPRSSFLAPPAGLPLTAPPPPPPKNQNSFVLAPPSLDGSTPLPGFGFNLQRPPLMPSQPTGFAISPPPQPNLPPPPPAIEHEGRNYIILQNFDETAIKDKDVQTQILFGRKFSKVRSASPSPCFLPSNILQNPRTPTNSAPSRDIPPSIEILLRACLTAILMLTRRFRG
jgi:vacuolar protein sorting-associated protein 72